MVTHYWRRATIGAVIALAIATAVMGVLFTHNRSEHQPIANAYTDMFNRTSVLRGHLAGQIIDLPTREPDGASSLALLRKAMQKSPIPAGPTRKPPTDIDLLDADGHVLLSVKIFEIGVVVGDQQFGFFEGQDCLRPFDEKYSQMTYFYPNGSRRADGVHDHGQKHGLWTYYYPSGSKREEGHYAWGRKVGRWIQWDELGQPISETDYGP